MEIGLYTAWVGRLGFEDALDVAAAVRARGIETPIENEDIAQDPMAGCAEAAEFLREFLVGPRT